MLQPERKRGRPPKLGAKADVRVNLALYPHEAQLIYDWMERHNVGQSDAVRQMLRLAAEAVNAQADQLAVAS